MTFYTVIIEKEKYSYGEKRIIEDVLKYRMISDCVFYVAGADYEKWIMLKDVNFVTVTEM